MPEEVELEAEMVPELVRENLHENLHDIAWEVLEPVPIAAVGRRGALVRNNNIEQDMEEFVKGHIVVCRTTEGYEGNKLTIGKVLTVEIVGKNVIGFKEILNEEGTPVKFFKHYFKIKNKTPYRLMREGDSVKYLGANWSVVSQEGSILELFYKGGGRDNRKVDLEIEDIIVSNQSVRLKDKVSFISLQALERHRDDGRYYLGPISMSVKDIQALYLKLEDKASFTVGKVYDRGSYVTLKGEYADLFIPMEMLIVVAHGVEAVLYKKGATVTFKKGEEATIGQDYEIVDVLQCAGKTIIGIKLDNGIAYVNKKQCKLKTKNEETVVKKECQNIF